MNPQSKEEIRSYCEARLNELQQSDLADLARFAECRLANVGLPPSAAEDMVQRALQGVLRGLESDQCGRKPRPENIENKDTFLNWLRGAICSIIEATGRKGEFRNPHKPWDDDAATSGVHRTESPANQVEVSDLAETLFERLRARTPGRLHPTILEWEQVYRESDRIPAVKNRRKYVHQIRYMARDIMSELEAGR